MFDKLNINFKKDKQIILICIIIGFFIYFRKLDYYTSMPRKSLLTSVMIAIWAYLSIKQPWFIIAGLVFLNVFGYKHKNKFKK